MKKKGFALNKWIFILIVIGVGGVLGFRFFQRFYEIAPRNSYALASISSLNQIIPVAVIGSGPAGLAAALYTARGGMHTVVFEGALPGGQLMGTSLVENWPGTPKKLGPDLIKGAHEQAAEFGAHFIHDTVIDVDFSQWPFVLKTENGLILRALTVIVASGATPRRLNAPGQPVVPGEDVFWGKGVSTCATCDAAFCRDADVAIVGGGDAAIEDALQLTPYARSITLLVRGDKMRATTVMQERLKAYKNIMVRYGTQVVAIEGGNGGDEHVTHVTVKKNGAAEQLLIRHLFLAIGHKPNVTPFEKYLKTDNDGYIKVFGHTQKTSVRGVFAAGDVADPRYRQAGVAAGDGIRAGLDALEFLRDIGFNSLVASQNEKRFFLPEGGAHRRPLKELKKHEDLDTVLASYENVVLDFYTEYCPSCAQLLPILELAATQNESIAFCKVDRLKVPKIGDRFNIESVPTVLVLHKGSVVGRIHKSMSLKEFNEFLAAALV